MYLISEVLNNRNASSSLKASLTVLEPIAPIVIFFNWKTFNMKKVETADNFNHSVGPNSPAFPLSMTRK